MAGYTIPRGQTDPTYEGNDDQLLNTIRMLKQKRAMEEAQAARASSSPVPEGGTPPWRVDPRKTQLWGTLVESDIPMEQWPVQPDPNNPDEMMAATQLVHDRNARGYDAGIASFLNENTLGLVPPIADRAERGQGEFPEQSAIGQAMGVGTGLAFDPIGMGISMGAGKLASMGGRYAMRGDRLRSAEQITDRVGSEVTSLADLVKGGDDDLNRLIQGYNDTVGPRNDAISALDSSRKGRQATNQSLIDDQALRGSDVGLGRAMLDEGRDAETFTKRRNAISSSADSELADLNRRMGDRQTARGNAYDYFNGADRLSLKEMQDMGIGNSDFVQGHLNDISSNLANERALQYGSGVAAGVGADYATDQDGYSLGDLPISIAASAAGVGLDRAMSKADEAQRLLRSSENKVPYAQGKPRSTTIRKGDQEIDLRSLKGSQKPGKGGVGGSGSGGEAGGGETPSTGSAGGLALDPENSAKLDGILDRAASDASLKKGEYRLGGKGYAGVIEELGLQDTPELRKIIQRKVAEKRKGLRDRRSSVRSTVGDNIGDMVGKGAAYLEGKWRKAGMIDSSQRMIDLDAQVAEMASRLPKGMTPDAVAEWRSTVRERLMRELGLTGRE